MNTDTTNCEHDWEPIIDGSPDYLVQVCMNCGLEHSTDLHTGQHTYVQGTHNPLSKPTHAGRKVMDYPDGISVEIYAAPVALPSGDDVCEWCDGKGCGNCNDEIYYREEAAAKKDAAVKQNPLLWDTPTRDFEDSPIPTKPTSADVPITVDEMIAFLQDASVDQGARIVGAIAWLRNLAAAAQVAIYPPFPPIESPAPNGGETAAHLCSVIGCGKVATHVSDVPYRDGVQAHYCDEHTLHERPIETAGAETVTTTNSAPTQREIARAVDTLLKHAPQPQPEPPATARKLSSVKLTVAQERVLKVLDYHATYDFVPEFRFHGNGSTFKGLEKRGWITRNDEGLCYITPAGRAALAARESEADK